ncbi:MAG: oxaloacetate decarboxylase [Gammaproteobacteria bacterium]|nr:oxaloacetate decarboxylase [Gammaproteobacteria bacterium]MBC55120.1 oxaloacetate decarboxylase [Gammaproteobacteria bacterium]|tara:strand:+ start:669 stop:935 length:267 start_codon:yes stop_codon:yes gene_type:complete
MSELITAGLNLALYGMGFVFTFLILLVILTTFMSAMVQRYAPGPLPAVPRRSAGRKSAQRPTSANTDQAKLVAVISAAIRQHRSGADD